MSEPRIMILDDDKKLASLICKYLSGFNMTGFSESDPVVGLERLKKEKFDVLLLDVMMPGKNGFEVLQELRSNKIQLPVIMLTARGEVADRVMGLELGADDYVPKPFEPREIVARIHAILRRKPANTESDIWRGEKFSIDYISKKVILDGQNLRLTSMEYRLLEYLVKNSGRIISRDDITEYLKGDEFEPFNRSVDILISRLRNKLKDDVKDPQYLRTEHGMGYVFIGK
ncbi:MAG: response regulator transcription factor [Leptospiraceae bacterium]|nr:response regulator transcription factor [Leptospiraceae bacterium]